MLAPDRQAESDKRVHSNVTALEPEAASSTYSQAHLSPRPLKALRWPLDTVTHLNNEDLLHTMPCTRHKPQAYAERTVPCTHTLGHHHTFL